jgi:hypothetical protein
MTYHYDHSGEEVAAGSSMEKVLLQSFERSGILTNIHGENASAISPRKD